MTILDTQKSGIEHDIIVVIVNEKGGGNHGVKDRKTQPDRWTDNGRQSRNDVAKPHRQMGMGRVITSGSLGSVMVSMVAVECQGHVRMGTDL